MCESPAISLHSGRPRAALAAVLPAARTWRRALILLALVFYVFAFQGARALWEPDEGRYTAVALEMGRLGDYLSPHLHHELEHLSKPPLTYWLLAASLRAFGIAEWAARVPNSLAFLATILLVAGLGRRLASGSPKLAPLIYATCVLPFVAANVVTTDTLLTLWETLAVYGFVELWWGPAERRELHRIVMWLGFGLAFLTKGPPGLLPLLAIVVLAVWAEGRKGLGRLVSLPALLGFGVVGLGWYLLLGIREPTALEHLIRYEVVDRIFTSAPDRNAAWYGPIVIYAPSLLLGSLPWTGRVLGACRDAWRSLRRRGEPDGASRDPVDLFLLLWVLLSLAVFLLARSRMHLYVLPLFVPLALLAARRRGPGFALTPRRQFGLALWVVFLVALRGLASLLPLDKDSRALAQAIAGGGRESINEVVFVDTHPRYGLAFYLGAEVEVVTLDPRPGGEPRLAETLGEELREEEGVRLFVLARKHAAAFRQLSQRLGFTAAPRGGWRELAFFRLQPSKAHPDLALRRRAGVGKRFRPLAKSFISWQFARTDQSLDPSQRTDRISGRVADLPACQRVDRLRRGGISDAPHRVAVRALLPWEGVKAIS